MLTALGTAPKFLRLLLSTTAVVLAVTVLLERWLELTPGSAFGEKGPVTWFSVLQLVVCGGLLLAVYSRRQCTDPGRSWRSPTFVWALMGVGFLGLACDEKFQLHENLDRQLHVLLAIQETPLTDRIDDLLIGLYGAIGVSVIWRYRGELQQHRRALPYLLAGMICFVATVVLDLLTNGPGVFPPAIDNWMKGLGEEGCKLLAESLFLVAAYDCFLRSKSGTYSASCPSNGNGTPSLAVCSSTSAAASSPAANRAQYSS